MSEGPGSRLAVTIDGVALADDEARALWRDFSAHMEANRGDVSGFAAKKGYASVAPQYQEGRAVLVIWVMASPPKPANAPRPRSPAAKAFTPPRHSPKAPARPRASGASALGRGQGAGGAKGQNKPARSGSSKRRG